MHRGEVKRLAPAILEEVGGEVVVLVGQVAAVALSHALRTLLVVVVEELQIGVGSLQRMDTCKWVKGQMQKQNEKEGYV